MEQPEKQITERESLSIIQQMIDTAKMEQKDNGKNWITWGWMLFLASILTVVNIKFQWFGTFFFWSMFGILTILIFSVQIVQAFFIKKKRKVKTYTRAIFDKLNIGFFVSLMYIIVAMNLRIINPITGFSLLISLYGFWILIYGALLNFKPSIVGAFITWGFAYAALFQTSFQMVMLLHAAATLCGYIIPGHIAYREFQKLHGRSTNPDISV